MVNRMLLVIDIGNTNINMGIFEDENLKIVHKIPSDRNLDINEYKKIFSQLFFKTNVTKCIISSVVDELSLIIKDVSDNFFKINSILLTINSNFDMDILLKNNQTVGIDRLVNASKVKKDFTTPAIIVDIGTATTIDVISKEGAFVGGAILPGIFLQYKALNMNTSKLPCLKEKISLTAIGDSTESALSSGVLRGHASAIEGLISQIESELNDKAIIIATGGDSEIISKYMLRKFDYINKNLTLESLKYLYELNRE